MKDHEPKRYFSNIMRPPTNEQHYRETSYGKMEIKVEKVLISLKRKLTKWRNHDN